MNIRWLITIGYIDLISIWLWQTARYLSSSTVLRGWGLSFRTFLIPPSTEANDTLWGPNICRHFNKQQRFQSAIVRRPRWTIRGGGERLAIVWVCDRVRMRRRGERERLWDFHELVGFKMQGREERRWFGGNDFGYNWMLHSARAKCKVCCSDLSVMTNERASRSEFCWLIYGLWLRFGASRVGRV